MSYGSLDKWKKNITANSRQWKKDTYASMVLIQCIYELEEITFPDAIKII